MSRREARTSINARQSDALAEFETWKKKLMQANRHIAKLNASLSVRIEELNGQTSSLYVENLRLRASEIALIAQLKREREKSRKIMSEAETATISLSKHLGLLRKSYNIPTESPQLVEVEPLPRARKPPTQPYPTSPSQQMQQNRISRLPDVPGIAEDEEPNEEVCEYDQPPPPRKPRASSGSSSNKPRLSASRLPLPSRVSSPPPVIFMPPAIPVQTQLGVATTTKRKASRRQSGMMTPTPTTPRDVNDFPRDSALSIPRAPSPAFGSPIRGGGRDILAEEDSPEADWEVDDAEMLVTRRPNRQQLDNGKGKEREDHQRTTQRERERVVDIGDEDGNSDEGRSSPIQRGKKPKLKDVTNSVQSRASDSDRDRRSHTPVGPPPSAEPPTDPTVAPRSTLDPNTLASRPSSSQSASRYPATLSRAHLATPQPSSSPVPETFETREPIPELLLDGGRERRTRKSVNYAEPKLNTKMRKPDGTGTTRKRSSSSAAHLPLLDSPDDADAESGTRSSLDGPVRSTTFPSSSSSSRHSHGATTSSSSSSKTNGAAHNTLSLPSRAQTRPDLGGGGATTVRRKKSRPTIVPSDDDEQDNSDGDEYVPERTATSSSKPRSRRRSPAISSGMYEAPES